MKLMLFRNEPQVVEFVNFKDARGRQPVPDREVRVLRVYESQEIDPRLQRFIPCGCPRVVRPDGSVAVWHHPECPEVERA